jgi:hypothetical protein
MGSTAAVGRRTRDELGGDDRVRAWPVVDDERLTRRGCHVLRDDARDDVGRPAGAEADDEPHRPPGLLRQHGGSEKNAQEEHPPHSSSSLK